METFKAFRFYLALKLHFTTDTYDVFKQHGRVKATKSSLYKRKDLYLIQKIAETYSEKEIVDFLVSNFITGDKWGGLFDSEAKENYILWKRNMESLTYNFDTQVNKILNLCEKHEVGFDSVFDSYNNQHPLILKLYLRKDVSIETMVILNKINSFVFKLDDALKNDLIWPELSRTIKKYDPFLKVNKDKYEQRLQRAIEATIETC
jgi:hypothetical protein